MADVAVDYGLLREVDRNVRVAISNIGVVSGQVDVLQAELDQAHERIKQLREFVEDMRREQRNAASLQRAITEIIRVRQELEQKFGKYQEVRDTMLGILQATDAALVTTSTISRVSEELMISTPQYWLAPCVVALAAWISNDEALATRAITEAIKRDLEKTSLVMALVCRRNGRLDTCKDWLSVYFERQDPNNISRSVLIFVNAYANGVFGPADARCDEFIQGKWMPRLVDLSLEQGIDFVGDQKRTWNGIFNETMKRSGTPTAKKYPILASHADVNDFANISAYVDRIDISGFINSYFDSIIYKSVDVEILKKQIDEYLISLVKDFDIVESGLREEEEKYQIIKELDGDVEVANIRIAEKNMAKQRMQEQVSLIEYLNEAVRGANDSDTNRDESEKKTALKFTKSYIQESYDDFMTEKKDTFPSQVRTKVGNVEHTVRTPEDKAKFGERIRQDLEGARAYALKNSPKGALTAGIVFAIIAVILLVVGFISEMGPIWGVIVLVIGAICIFAGIGKLSSYKKSVNIKFDKQIQEETSIAARIVDEWVRLNGEVNAYNAQEKYDITSKI